MRKKLIEVALPLPAVNAVAAREKSIRHGHPSTLHLWWARRPLAAARAVIFAQMVDDPSEYVDVLLSDAGKKRAAQRELKKRLTARASAAAAPPATGNGNIGAGEKPDATVEAPPRAPALGDVAAELERARLFGILEELVLWENTTNEEVLKRARTEIWQSWRRACAENAGHPRAAELFDRHTLPAFHDPFAGGGALPLEAQRLGLEAHASDLNPVAVLINKAMIEIPPKFAGRPPVNPESQGEPTIIAKTWRGAQGLAEDVRHYGQWMRDEAKKRIGHLYPPVEVTSALVRERPDLKPYEGRKLTVIAWLWARTVKSPNPAFADVDVPLASTFMLSTKKGKEAYVEPAIEGRGYRFTVKVGAAPDPDAAKAGTKLSRGANFRCLMSGSPIAGAYIKTERQAKRMGARLMAVVAEGDRGRVYLPHLPPTAAHEEAAWKAIPEWRPDVEFFQQALGFRVGNYGMTKWSDLLALRQLVALTSFSDLVREAAERVRHDAAAAGLPDDDRPLHRAGTGATAYAEAIGVYLGFAVSKTANRASTLCTFKIAVECPGDTFGRQALPMSWDYAEANALNGPSGSLESMVKNTAAGQEPRHVRTSFAGTWEVFIPPRQSVRGRRGKERFRKPMVHGIKKSDEAGVPLKAANKGAQAPAEPPEGRASAKGNSRDQSTYRTQGRESVSQAVERIRQAATRKPQEKLTALLHHITTDALRCAFFDLKQTASAGVDGLVWKAYADGLDERLLDLHGRVHSGAYRALPSRRVATNIGSVNPAETHVQQFPGDTWRERA